MDYKIVQLGLTPGKNANTVGDIFIAEPDTTKESLAGRIFVLIEVESKRSEGVKIINFLLDNINYNYYQNEKIYLRERINALKVEYIFEAALAKVNKNFIDYLKSEKINLPKSAINITVGLIYKNELYFSGCGKNRALLIYRAPDTSRNGAKKMSTEKDPASVRKEYSLSDISEQTGTGEVKPDGSAIQTKLFSNVISGKIPKNGFFVFTNETLPEYISGAQLTRIITTLPPLSAVEQLKNTLSKINSYVSFWGIIIKNTQFEKAEETKQQSSSKDSVVDLSRTEERTENLLAPSGIINIKKPLSYIGSLLPGSDKAMSGIGGAMIKDKIFVKKKSVAKKLNLILKNFFTYALNFLFFAAKWLSSRGSIEKTVSALGSKLKNSSECLSLPRLTLNKRNKALLIVAVVFLVFFIVNLSFMKAKKNRQTELENYENLSAMIEQKQNQAEANLLYSNEEGAKKLFDEISVLMGSLPQATEEQKSRFADFTEKYNLQLEKIRRITRIDEPEEVADFKNLTSSADPANIILSANNGKIYAADSGQRSIYILEIADRLVTTVTDLEEPMEELLLPAQAAERVYYLNKTNIIELDLKTEELSPLNIDLDANNNYMGADTYNERLYLLDNKNGQIIRYAKNGRAFSSAYSWLQENTDLSAAVDLSIDGHVYVLKNNGEVIKFLRGQTVEFALEAVDPPIEQASKIFVSPKNNYIYILDPKSQRLIVYDKTGQFQAQYTSKTFTDLKDFAVDETSQEVYLLSGAKVLKIKIGQENE